MFGYALMLFGRSRLLLTSVYSGFELLLPIFVIVLVAVDDDVRCRRVVVDAYKSIVEEMCFRCPGTLMII